MGKRNFSTERNAEKTDRPIAQSQSTEEKYKWAREHGNDDWMQYHEGVCDCKDDQTR